jgi:hypothetical protein
MIGRFPEKLLLDRSRMLSSFRLPKVTGRLELRALLLRFLKYHNDII